MKDSEAKSITSPKREEIIHRAYEVFYRDGFHAAGVDSLLKGTGISKRTLYNYFDSKEDLIAATIQHYHDAASQRIQDYVNENGGRSPVQKIMSYFDWLEEVLKSGHTSGCYAINAKLEYANQEPKIVKVCDAYYGMIENKLADLCREAHCKDPKKIGRQIVILFQGAIVNGMGRSDTSSVQVARSAVKVLMEHATS